MTRQPRRMSGATTIAAAVLGAAVLIPTASMAAGSLVTISDPTTSSAAKVSTLGRLQVENVSATDLLLRTPPGATSFAAGTTKHLGNIATGDYDKLRIVATNRNGSASNISFRFTILEGNELVAQLATFSLAPKSSRTLIVDVPARAVAIYADAAPGSGTVATDVLVYGSR